jgi:hypothetical protein
MHIFQPKKEIRTKAQLQSQPTDERQTEKHNKSRNKRTATSDAFEEVTWLLNQAFASVAGPISVLPKDRRQQRRLTFPQSILYQIMLAPMRETRWLFSVHGYLELRVPVGP